MLRYIRITLGTVIFLLSLMFFLDFASLLPLQLHGVFHLQLIPAILSYSWIIVVVLLLSIILFGRVYCSVLCPFGIMQDTILWGKRMYLKISDRIKKTTPGTRGKRTKKVYRPPHNAVRYAFLAAAVVPVFFGSTVVLTLIDPYSGFGRICMGILRPVYVWGNNAMASVLNASGNYSMYAVSQQVSVPLLIFAVITLVVVVAMVVTRGRLWCNTVCPVGGLFSLLSRYSIFKIAISESKCVHCNKCTNACKSECIDHKNLKVDNSRCVVCFNCIEKCDKNAIGYKLGYGKTFAAAEPVSVESSDQSRRRFIAGTASALALMPLTSVAGTLGVGTPEKRVYPLPPGAVPNFKNRCTGCQLCVSKCPMHLLRPSFMERGFSGIMQPHMYFQPHSYCSWECTICGSVCPNGALERLTVEAKKVRQVGIVQFVVEECVVYKDNYDCGACAEHCPTQAVRMVPYKDGLTIPKTDQSTCIGCGACESICPMRPHAIFVAGKEPQGVAKAPEATEQQTIEVNDFGF